ncbi:MAG: hypothetical protein AABX85_04180, partial [Nanoarchaeota archaeon]
NMTSPFTTWLSTFVYNYNQTTPANLYTDAVVSGSNASWLSTYNATYAANMANNSWNESYANTKYAEIKWGYNMTSPFTTWLSTFVYNYNQTTPANAYTNTKVGTANLHIHDALNITSPLWVNKTGDTMTGNLNISSKNVTSVDCIVFASGGKICSA